MDAPRTFHLHMISDATGETLVAIAKAVREGSIAPQTVVGGLVILASLLLTQRS